MPRRKRLTRRALERFFRRAMAPDSVAGGIIRAYGDWPGRMNAPPPRERRVKRGKR